MIQKLSNNKTPVYEILDYIITPSSSEVNTEVLVDGTTVVEMTCMLRNRSYDNSRFFSSNDTNTDEGWHAYGTWGLQFEDSGLNLSIKMLGADYSKLGSSVIVKTGITYNDLNNKKLRYNLSSAGILTIFNEDDTVFRSYDATKDTNTSATSSTPIKLFSRYRSAESINNETYVYDVKIWKNDVLIRHYLPVKRLSDNTYGLYDIVNNTFHKNEISGYSFTGTSKSEKEYIYSSQTQYVNDIVINGTHINRIYNKGEIYWGNDNYTKPSWHGIRGTANVTSTILTNAISFNDTMYNVYVDENGKWEIEYNDQIYTSSNTQSLCNSNNITSIDFRNTIWATRSDTNRDTFGNLFFSGNVSNLKDVYFDFTGQNTNDMCLDSGIFSALTNCRLHGLGTLNWSGEIDVSNTTSKHTFSLREFNRNGIIGTLDLRGIDTTSITDQDVSSIHNTALSFDWTYGYWYLFPNNVHCDTIIIGSLEIQTNYFTSWNGPASYCKTLYCTSQTPPSLSRTGANGLTCYNWLNRLSTLQNIYVPVGCLEAYQNDPNWSAKASIMSEKEAPDPLSI